MINPYAVKKAAGKFVVVDTTFENEVVARPFATKKQAVSALKRAEADLRELMGSVAGDISDMPGHRESEVA